MASRRCDTAGKCIRDLGIQERGLETLGEYSRKHHPDARNVSMQSEREWGHCPFDSGGKHAADMAANGGYFERLPNPPLDLMKEISFMDVQKFRKTIPMYSDEELGILEKKGQISVRKYRLLHSRRGLEGKIGNDRDFCGTPLHRMAVHPGGRAGYAGELLEAAGDAAVENMRRYLQAVGPYIDTILISTTDFGTQTGELFSPETFRELYMPNYKRCAALSIRTHRQKPCFTVAGLFEILFPSLLRPAVTS